MNDKFSEHLKSALETASKTAQSWQENLVTPNHLFYSLTKQKGSLAQELLNHNKVETQNFSSLRIEQKQTSAPQPNGLKFSEPSLRIIEKACVLALKFHHPYVGSEHLLAALLESPSNEITALLKTKQVKKEKLKKEVLNILRGTSRLPDMTVLLKELENEEKQFRAGQQSGVLNKFSQDLTEETFQKSVNPVIGREQELEMLIQILSRKDKNNPIILGDPGVGKTALVEGLAKKILQNKVPTILANKKILALDLALIVAGTNYRGEFEARLKAITEEIKSNQDIIIFIDEIHNLIGAGSTNGTLDAANILKPLLSRGEIRCIGATTLDEHKKHIESDAALARRFQPIMLNEPTASETIEILHGIKENYEVYHKVKYTDQAIEAAVNLSHQYLPEKFLPDKAIDLLDESAARVKMQHVQANPQILQSYKLKKQLEKTQQQKLDAVHQENFNLALKIKETETEIKEKIAALKNTEIKETEILPMVQAQDMALLINQKTNISLDELGSSVDEYARALKKQLAQKIVGQDKAIEQVVNIIKQHKLGLHDPDQPIASLLFAGPSGVGKTYFAQVLAEKYFHDPKALIRLDMSEFNDKMSLTKLIGAPAGYVGYKEGTKLADAVRRKPHNIILFDEIEKAHPEIINLIIQILDNGEITDANGKLVNFKNSIILCTTNLGADLWDKKKSEIGFGDNIGERSLDKLGMTKVSLQDLLAKNLSQEFLPRLDQTIVFNNFTLKNFQKMVKLNIEELNQRLNKKNIQLEFSNSAIIHLSKQAEALNQGARGIRKIIKQAVETQSFDKLGMTNASLQPGKTVVIDLDAQTNALIIS